MSKLINLIIFTSVLVLLLHFAGVLTDEEGTGYLLKHLGITDPSNIGSKTFWTTLAGLGAIAATGVTIGTLRGTSGMEIMMLTVGVVMIPIFFLIAWDLVALFNIFAEISRAFAVLIFSPLLILYALSVYEWLRGTE